MSDGTCKGPPVIVTGAAFAVGAILAAPLSIPTLGCLSICLAPTDRTQFVCILIGTVFGTLVGIWIVDIIVPAIFVLLVTTILSACSDNPVARSAEDNVSTCLDVPFNMI